MSDEWMHEVKKKKSVYASTGEPTMLLLFKKNTVNDIIIRPGLFCLLLLFFLMLQNGTSHGSSEEIITFYEIEYY